MHKPSPKEINDIRKHGFRPVVVSCFLNSKKILFLYQKEYNLWQLPQGGIENNEDIVAALQRETEEELGKEFADAIDKKIIFLGDDQIEFPPATRGSRELKDDDGNTQIMIGKKYFFVAAEVGESQLDIKKTEFDDYKWVSYKEAVDFAQEIYQPGKRRITLKAVELLKSLNLA